MARPVRAAQDSTRRRRPHASGGALRAALAGVALGLLVGCASPSDAAREADRGEASIDRLSWLVGDWRRLGSTMAAGERWWRDGDALVAEAWHTGESGRVLDERLAIEPRGDGLVYRATVVARGGPPTDFALVHQGPGVAVFENRAHGHPWRIEYAASDDLLLARVHFAGRAGAADRVLELSFVRPSGAPVR